MRIEIISGSSRSISTTVRVAKYLQNYFLAIGNDAGLIDMREVDIPILENVLPSAADAPEDMKPVAERMFAADAFILVSPEYNGSYTACLKNLLDHFPKQRHKSFGIVTASPGALGGIRAAQQLQLLVSALFGIASPYMLVTPFVDKKFNEQSELIDPTFEKSVQLFVTEFLWLANKINDKK